MKPAGSSSGLFGALKFTLTLIILGAIGGAITALLSIGLVWFGVAGVPVGRWMLGILSIVGAILGAVLMPIFGWLLRGRYRPARATAEITLGASVVANLAAIALRNLDSGVLIGGAFVGAPLAFLRMRFLGKPAL